MSYSLQSSDGSVQAFLRRVASEQMDAAEAAMAGETGMDRAAAIHDARKRLKKLRGLVRLMRGGFPDYSAANRSMRNAARLLSDLRDRTAVIETYDRLMAGDSAAGIDGRRTRPLRLAFEAARDEAMAAPDLDDRVAAFRDALAAIRKDVDGWRLTENGWDALELGLLRTYGRARDDLAPAKKSRDGAAIHEWRKRVKYNWYHTRLLRRLWPEVLTPRAEELSRLSDLLGDRHDFDVFRPHLADAPLDADLVAQLEQAMAARIEAQEAEAFALGRRLFAAKPKALAREWRACWRVRFR
ncbi:CHAD domain-containing protein [Wenxinia marina]|uniref:CHAD domain-containing protein n=1 Tax=Wenxinia marina DSM 24838 TaxID=1123501 RepID=A0A0D0P791_9RHOB|nr:CHAD domain-containing protein [Wenxinia marina]KIQ67456.1 hypothetical protein Wenmar_03879 [Wenxinia marina DSM 24838]GGL69386.1 CHAD domain-containing protein [Wenxinia marina]